MKKSLNLAQKTIEEFLSVIGIKDPFELSESEEGFDVVLDTQESGIIIGRHGDNLEAIQLVLLRSETIRKTGLIFSLI